MELKDLLVVLKRRALLMVAILAVTLVVGAYVTVQQTTTSYRVQARLLIPYDQIPFNPSQQEFIQQGQQDFPGLNPFSNDAQTQHLATTALAAPIVGQTATSIGGGLVEILENLLQGTNTAERPRAIEDTTLDFLANQLGASGVDPEIAVEELNALQQQLAGASPEEQFAIQDQIAPIAGPLSRALVNPGTITTSPLQGLLAALMR